MSDSIQLLSSWLLTYAVHSTLLIGAAWLISQNARRLSMIARDTMWKAALYGGIFTASLQVGLGGENPAVRWPSPPWLRSYRGSRNAVY